MEPSQHSEDQEGQYNADENDFSGDGETNFSSNLDNSFNSQQDDTSFDDDESDTYYSEGQSTSYMSGPSQQSFKSPGGSSRKSGKSDYGRFESGESSHQTTSDSGGNDSLKSESYTSEQSRRINFEEDQTDNFSASEAESAGAQELPMRQEYRVEFARLIELAESGHDLTEEQEERLYFMELYARRLVGEELEEEELLDLDEFLRQEEEIMAERESQRKGTEADEMESPSINGPLQRNVKDDTNSEGESRDDAFNQSGAFSMPENDLDIQMPVSRHNGLASSEMQTPSKTERIHALASSMVVSESESTEEGDKVKDDGLREFGAFPTQTNETEKIGNDVENQGFSDQEFATFDKDNSRDEDGFDSDENDDTGPIEVLPIGFTQFDNFPADQVDDNKNEYKATNDAIKQQPGIGGNENSAPGDFAQFDSFPNQREGGDQPDDSSLTNEDEARDRIKPRVDGQSESDSTRSGGSQMSAPEQVGSSKHSRKSFKGPLAAFDSDGFAESGLDSPLVTGAETATTMGSDSAPGQSYAQSSHGEGSEDESPISSDTDSADHGFDQTDMKPQNAGFADDGFGQFEAFPTAEDGGRNENDDYQVSPAAFANSDFVDDGFGIFDAFPAAHGDKSDNDEIDGGHSSLHEAEPEPEVSDEETSSVGETAPLERYSDFAADGFGQFHPQGEDGGFPDDRLSDFDAFPIADDAEGDGSNDDGDQASLHESEPEAPSEETRSDVKHIARDTDSFGPQGEDEGFPDSGSQDGGFTDNGFGDFDVFPVADDAKGDNSGKDYGDRSSLHEPVSEASYTSKVSDADGPGQFDPHGKESDFAGDGFSQFGDIQTQLKDEITKDTSRSRGGNESQDINVPISATEGEESEFSGNESQRSRVSDSGSQFSSHDVSEGSPCSKHSREVGYESNNDSQSRTDDCEQGSYENQSVGSSNANTENEIPSFAEDGFSPYPNPAKTARAKFNQLPGAFEGESSVGDGFGQFGTFSTDKWDNQNDHEEPGFETGENKSQDAAIVQTESAPGNDQQSKPSSSSKLSSRSLYSESEFGTDTPSFAEESIFSTDKGKKDFSSFDQRPDVFEHDGFVDDGFGEISNFSNFQTQQQQERPQDEDSSDKKDVGNNAFDNNGSFEAFNRGDDGFGSEGSFGGDSFGNDDDGFGDDDMNSEIGAQSLRSRSASEQGQSRQSASRSLRSSSHTHLSGTESRQSANRSLRSSSHTHLSGTERHEEVSDESSRRSSKLLSSYPHGDNGSFHSAFSQESEWSQGNPPENVNDSNSRQSQSQNNSFSESPSQKNTVRSTAGSTESSTSSRSRSAVTTNSQSSSSGKGGATEKSFRSEKSRSHSGSNSLQSVGGQDSAHLGSRSPKQSTTEAKWLVDTTVSSHFEVQSESEGLASVSLNGSQSLVSAHDDASRSIYSQSIQSAAGDDFSKDMQQADESITPADLERQLSKEQSNDSQDEKSVLTTGEKSVRFNMTPKPSQQSEPSLLPSESSLNLESEISLRLGEVFEEFQEEEAQGVGEKSREDKRQTKGSATPFGSPTAEKPKLYPKYSRKFTSEERKKKRKKRRRLRKEAKSPALLDWVANVNDAMIELENREDETKEDEETSAHQLLHGFDALVGIYLQLSDEVELMSTFSALKKKKKKKEKEEKEDANDEDPVVPHQALKEVLSFAESLDQLFADLKPVILDCFEEEPDEDMNDMLFRLNSLVDLLCETSHRVGEKQEWNDRVETTYVTLMELMELETLELQCFFEDVDVPDQGLSANIHEAWTATGHLEELRALEESNDPWIFRQICYEVMVSTDQWCPDITILMEICGIDASMLEEEPDPEYLEEEDFAPTPQAAEHVLDKINGDPLARSPTLASILRRILPPRAMTDMTLLDNFTSIRNTLNNPLGLSATNIVAISSEPEVLNDPDSVGVGGIGKTTLAAMVAEHLDVRRYFIDGVVWIYVGDKELTYNRYTQCLRELVAQLDFYDGVPLFAELIHTPGESLSKRRRREEGFMIYARDTIVELLGDRSVLIILDDVCFEPDLDWFDFAPMPEDEEDDIGSDVALLVTTRQRDLLPAADTVEVDMLDEADAITLLIQESGQLSHTLMAESREARSVVQECANHPLAVKSVGRWLNLKHATAGVVSSVEEIHDEVVKSMDKILKGGDHSGADMMYEILSLSLSPAINGEPTNIIKFCFAAFVIVFCDKQYISDFALTEPSPIIPMDMAELLFETLLEINESSLLQEGSLFYAQKKEAAVLIPEALSALGVLKVITYSDAEDEEEEPEDEQKFLQVMHFIHHEYGEYLCYEEAALKDLTKDAETEWNRALVVSSLKEVEEWDMDLEDAGQSYALEMIVSHMIRGGMYTEAADLLANRSYVRGRLLSLGRENATRRHIKDCVLISNKLNEGRTKLKLEPRSVMKRAYQALGSQLTMDFDNEVIEDPRIKDVEIARAHNEIGFSLAENRCWDAAIAHWENSQELLEKALGTVEIVAGILFNIGVAYSEMNEYEQALDSIKQCLRIRGSIHGEKHILYAQTIQKIGDTFLGMSDYQEAVESYNWALDVMYKEPTLHRVEIGEILDNKGIIHYSKGEIEEALNCHQEALRSKQADLGEDHPELCETYHHIGNCLSDQENIDDAIIHFEEAIRLKELDLDGGPERDADILTYEGILHNLEGNQEEGLECYEKSLQLLVTKVPHRKEKVASLLHLIGCVYLMSGEQKKAMKLFEESLQARRKVLGFVHLDVASTLFNVAFLYQTRHRLDKALKCLEEALKIRQLRLPDSEKVAVTHEKIGSLARAIGKTKKAQIAFEGALKIRKLIHGEQHEAVATVLQELGDLMDDIGEYDTAMSHYIDALDIRRIRLGLDDIAVAETLYSMGYTLHNSDEPDRALVCFEESLSIRRYQLGEDSKEVGDTLNMMGFLKAKRGELEDALTILWDALRIRKLQQDNVKVSETLKNIGNVHREKQEYGMAVKCYEECLRIRKTELGDDHEKVADALIAMGNVHGDMKQTDTAMRSYQQALKIRTMVFGEQDESVAAVLQYMGTMEFRSGNQERARDLLTEFIRIRRDNNTKNDGDYVNVLFMIGNIHKMQGNEGDARLCWTEAYQVFKELGLEETNPQIAAVMNDLLENHMNQPNQEEEKGKSGAALAFLNKFTQLTKETVDNEEKNERKGGKMMGRKGKGQKLY